MRTLCTVIAALCIPGSAWATPQGQLEIIDDQGKPQGLCPLSHTDVQAEASGFITRVHVTQVFHNPRDQKIEAIYTFPLPGAAAVDDMTMTVGDRVIRGKVKERDEARQVYEAAKAAGHVASLLDQERPNIFTQAVANIEPRQSVEIRISYTELLAFSDGLYRFVFPMVVGPRYIPGGGATGDPLAGRVPGSGQVPDASKITPPVTPEGTRAGHDINVQVRIHAGAPIGPIESEQHAIDTDYLDKEKTSALVKLVNARTIPNKDFVLTFSAVGQGITDTVLTHTDERGKFLTLILQPPKRVTPDQIRPKEMIFVIDKSGSMRGFPIETAKSAMQLCINNLHPKDTFNLMTFAGGVGFCFPEPVPNTPENRAKALAYLQSLQGSGGTEMMKAIHACLDRPADPERVRIVNFMTDGYVGNDMAIIGAVRDNADVARIFSFGIGTSVNRYLLSQIAAAGRGQADFILSASQAAQSAQRFYQRVTAPVLTDIELDFGDLPVEEVYPKRIPDLFSVEPIVVAARYTGPGSGTITVRGNTGGGAFSRSISVDLPDEAPANESLAAVWARKKVRHLMNQDLAAIQRGEPAPEIKQAVTDLGVAYRLMTQFTSFVAVEELRVTEGGEPVTVDVPVEMPEGVSYEGVFGRNDGVAGNRIQMNAGQRQYMVAQVGAMPKSGGPRPALQTVAPPPKESMVRRLKSLGYAGRAADLSTVVVAGEAEEEHKAKDGDAEKNLPPHVLKIDPSLRDLIDKVDADGNCTKGSIHVTAWTVRVTLTLDRIDDAIRKELAAAGFTILAQARSASVLVGTLDLRKLDEIARLEAVARIAPAGT